MTTTTTPAPDALAQAERLTQKIAGAIGSIALQAGGSADAEDLPGLSAELDQAMRATYELGLLLETTRDTVAREHTAAQRVIWGLIRAAGGKITVPAWVQEEADFTKSKIERRDNDLSGSITFSIVTIG